MSDDVNEVVFSGRLVDPPDRRHSPAGVPIARFTLLSESRQREGDVERTIRLMAGVRAAGEALADTVRQLDAGTAVRVKGYLARARLREGESRLIIIANAIETLAEPND